MGENLGKDAVKAWSEHLVQLPLSHRFLLGHWLLLDHLLSGKVDLGSGSESDGDGGGHSGS